MFKKYVFLIIIKMFDQFLVALFWWKTNLKGGQLA